jgi:hypothetical protein
VDGDNAWDFSHDVAKVCLDFDPYKPEGANEGMKVRMKA